METLQLISQGLVVALLGRLVYQLGHLTGTVDGLAHRLTRLEGWREHFNLPKL